MSIDRITARVQPYSVQRGLYWQIDIRTVLHTHDQALD